MELEEPKNKKLKMETVAKVSKTPAWIYSMA